MVAATVLEHVLHTLLHTFAILGVHDLKQLASVHWLRFRKAEQPSPFLRYPKFVIPKVPNPQTEVCRVGCEVNARFALPQRHLSLSAFRHGGGKRHRSNGEHSRPGLQSKKRLVFRFPDEWPETMQCAPNRDRRENEDARSGFALRKAEGHPNHNRSGDESDWIIPGRNCKPSAKDRFAQDAQQQQENADFRCFLPVPAPLWCDAPENNRWSDQKIARCVAQPPRQPDRAIIRPIRRTSKCKTGHTKDWADNCANRCCEREFKNTLRTIENGCATGEPIHYPGTAYGLERVAARDGKRRGGIARSGNVHQKCTEKNGRPDSVTKHEQCGERNSRRRPHRRCTWVQRCQHQSELASNEIDKR